MRPRIGITTASWSKGTDFFLRRPYVEAIADAGGLPILIPCTERVPAREMADAVDGLLLSGGGDVDPDWFGEEPHRANGAIDPVADHFEIELCRLFLGAERPILGICRGIQVLNVAAGGDIFQDLVEQTNTQLQHAQKAPEWYATHRIAIEQGTLLHRVLGETQMRVNSFHHQGVRRVAPGFVACAQASDQLTEAIEKPGSAWTLGIQWHPERTYEKNEAERALFRAFVDACRS